MAVTENLSDFLKIGIAYGQRPVSKKPKEPMIISLPNGSANGNRANLCELLALYSAGTPTEEQNLKFTENGVEYEVSMGSTVNNQEEIFTISVKMKRSISTVLPSTPIL